MRRTLFALLLCMPLSTYAFVDPVADALLAVMKELDVEHLPKLSSIDDLMHNLKSDMKNYMSGRQYGADVNEKYQTWSSAQHWDDFLRLAGGGGSSQDNLSGIVKTINQQFPISKSVDTFKQINNSENDQKYYAIQAQTALAVRAASQHEFDQIEKEITYQKTLEAEAKNTDTLKASIDVQNKLQLENNLIMLSMLRQISLLNQQKALDTQEAVNSVYENASFLQKK